MSKYNLGREGVANFGPTTPVFRDGVFVGAFRWAHDALAYIEHCEKAEALGIQHDACNPVPHNPRSLSHGAKCRSCNDTGIEHDGAGHACTDCNEGTIMRVRLAEQRMGH